MATPLGYLVRVHNYTGSTTHHFVAYDGNGNIAALIDASSGASTARYEYGPFGEATRATGAIARKNPLRFSTKFTDNESGLLYYGFRHYAPSLGRWTSRDPIGERGGRCIYGFVENRPLDSYDSLGLCCCVRYGPIILFDQSKDDEGKVGIEFWIIVAFKQDGTPSKFGGKDKCCNVSDCQFKQKVEGYWIKNGKERTMYAGDSGGRQIVRRDSFVDDIVDNDMSNSPRDFDESRYR